MSAISGFRQAVYDRLSGDAALSAAIVAVYGDVAPQTADGGSESAFPYVVIGLTDFDGYHDARASGFDVLMRLHSWSRASGSMECRDIQDLIYAALHRAEGSLTISGHSVLLIDRESSFVQMEDHDGSFHGVCEYRALITRNTADY